MVKSQRWNCMLAKGRWCGCLLTLMNEKIQGLILTNAGKQRKFFDFLKANVMQILNPD